MMTHDVFLNRPHSPGGIERFIHAGTTHADPPASACNGVRTRPLPSMTAARPLS